jgi:DNA polymerase-3 subunit alpha
MAKATEQFVHLHVHSEYSHLDGATRLEQLIARCKELNMPAVALTDHGNMYAAWKFYKLCKAKGIKPIVGCEFYICENHLDRGGDKRFERRENHHLILLAKNVEGYRNLCQLNTIAYTLGFYRRPRIDFDLLSAHSEGLICLSACIAGELPRLFLENYSDEAYALAAKYKQLFGSDYYIELQDHAIKEERDVMPQLIALAQQLDIKMVVTNDVHYLNRDDSELQDIMMCVQMGKFYDDPDRMKFPGDSFYLKTYDEMAQLFPQFPEVLSNTLEVAEKCDLVLGREDLIPEYTPPEGLSKEEFFRKLIEEGLAERYATITDEIRQRYEYEYKVISEMGYIDYYLIVWDFIHYAKTNGIPVGPGRGSGAASVIAYAIGITDVEPFRYNLLFERFLNPHRKTMPDFDVDFCMDRRGEVVDYVHAKYGAGKVSQIITFGSMKAKNAIRDVSRVLRLPISEAGKLAKYVPDNWKFTLNHLLGITEFDNPEDKYISRELLAAYEVEPTRHILDIARRIEGAPRNTGMHAAGVVISKHVLSDYVPMQTNGGSLDNGGIFTTQYNMSEVEEAGLLKMDFLGLRTLTDIKKACDYIFATKGVKLDFSTCTYDDPEVFKTICGGDTMGIFQLESGGMTSLMKRMQPDGLEDIIAGISLYRPGPMQFIDKYIGGKKNKSSITYTHPSMEPILSVTYGCIVYQEQVMQIVRELAGFSTALADNVRYAMSKKKKEMMEKLGQLFIYGGRDAGSGEEVVGCIANGIDEKTAKHIYEELDAFSQYAFNKAHAACYAYVCYQTAFLKTYYPTELLCAMLNNRISDIAEIKRYTTYAADVGIKMLPPDVNKSSAEFTVEDGSIRFGLGAIKNIGVGVIEGIASERARAGEYASMKDLFERSGHIVNKRMIENLIKGGAFDCFGRTRADMMQWHATEYEQVSDSVKKRESGQISLFDLAPELKTQEDNNHTMVKEWASAVKFGFEKEVLGFYMSGSPLDDFDMYHKKYSFNFDTRELPTESSETEEEGSVFVMTDSVTVNKRAVTAGGILREVRVVKGREGGMMGFAKLEDKYGLVEVAAYGSVFEKYKTLFAEDAFLIIKGQLTDGRDNYKINIREIINPQANATPEQPAKITNPDQPALCLKMEHHDDVKYGEVMAVIRQYKGDLAVKLKIAGKLYQVPETVRECNGIQYELSALLGEENVLFYTKKAK